MTAAATLAQAQPGMHPPQAPTIRHKPFSRMTLREIERYQMRLISLDHWILDTRRVHYPEVVSFSRHRIRWTKRELRETRKKMRGSSYVTRPAAMGSRTATWYGPGFYYHRTSCGRTYTPGSQWIAAAGVGCGTPVTICYSGRCVRTSVQDSGGAFDMTNGVVYALCGCYHTLTVQYRYG